MFTCPKLAHDAWHINIHALFYSISPPGHGSHFQTVRHLIPSWGRRCGFGVKSRSKTCSPFLPNFHEGPYHVCNVAHVQPTGPQRKDAPRFFPLYIARKSSYRFSQMAETRRIHVAVQQIIPSPHATASFPLRTSQQPRCSVSVWLLPRETGLNGKTPPAS